MTGLSYRRIALIFALNVPLYRNIEFGQFYLLLLFYDRCRLLGLRCEGRHALAGVAGGDRRGCKDLSVAPLRLSSSGGAIGEP